MKLSSFFFFYSVDYLKFRFDIISIIYVLDAAMYTWIWDTPCFLLLVVTFIEPLSTFCVGVFTVECFKHCDVQTQGEQIWYCYAKASECAWLSSFIVSLINWLFYAVTVKSLGHTEVRWWLGWSPSYDTSGSTA